MSDVKKDLLDFQIHCLNTDQLQVAELVKNAQKRIAELEQELNNMNHLLDNYDFVNCLNGKEHEIRDLEQQAKGIEDYAKESCVGIDGAWMVAKASKLREQAKQSKSAINLELKQNLGNWKGGEL